MEAQPAPSARYFDGWYADMAVSPVKDEIQRRHLGLPSHLVSTSLLGWEGIAEVAEALDLSPGETLLDLACGRGGYGLEVAAQTGARLVGVDFSAEAVRQAREHARRLGRRADFRIGDLAATGLMPARPTAQRVHGPAAKPGRACAAAAARPARPRPGPRPARPC